MTYIIISYIIHHDIPSKAAWCISFFGIQPTFTQVPPRPGTDNKKQELKSIKSDRLRSGPWLSFKGCNLQHLLHTYY